MSLLKDYLWVLILLTLLIWVYLLGRKPSPKTLRDLEYSTNKSRYFPKRFEISDQFILEQYTFRKRRSSSISQGTRIEVLSKTKGRCFYCSFNINEKLNWQVDHFWPVRYGGTDDIANLVPSCVPCNKMKWAYIPINFFLFKWVRNIPFTEYERHFIDTHRSMSLHYLTTSEFYKRICEWWCQGLFNEFADLVLCSPGILSLPDADKEELICKAENIFQKMELFKIGNPGKMTIRDVIDNKYGIMQDNRD